MLKQPEPFYQMEESNSYWTILLPKTTEEKLNYINSRDIHVFLQFEAFLCKAFQNVSFSYMFPSVASAPPTHCFIGIYRKWDISGYFLEVSCLTCFFPLRRVLFLSMYVLFNLFLCFQSFLRHWWQQTELCSPSVLGRASGYTCCSLVGLHMHSLACDSSRNRCLWVGSGLPATGCVSVILWTIVGTLTSGTIKSND